MKNPTIIFTVLCLCVLCAVPALAQSGLEVSGIMMGGGDPVAIVNGKMVKAGDEVGGFRVIIIKDDFVAFLTPEGEPLDVWLQPIKNEASSVQQSPAYEAEKEQGLWEKFMSLFHRKDQSASEEADKVEARNPFFGYLSNTLSAKKRAEEAAAEQMRRIQEAEADMRASSQEDLAEDSAQMNQQIMEARRLLYQADSFRGRGILTAQFFQDKISLYDDAERKLQDALSKTLDMQKQSDIKEVMEDIRNKKMALYREKKKFDRNIQTAIQAKKLLIGMTKADVKNALGLPDSGGKESQGNILLERWTYQERFGHPAAEAFFQDGILIDAQAH